MKKLLLVVVSATFYCCANQKDISTLDNTGVSVEGRVELDNGSYKYFMRPTNRLTRTFVLVLPVYLPVKHVISLE